MILPLEPNGPPTNVKATAQNSTTISVSWGPVVEQDRNGIIKGYEIIYQALPNGSNMAKMINISTENQESEQDTTLDGLNEFTNYSIRLLAFTSEGNGPFSDAIVVQTQQDSKLSQIIYEINHIRPAGDK